MKLSWAKPGEIEAIKAQYEGKRIRLINMLEDPDPVEPGTEGTVILVDGAGHLMVDWDNGRNLNVIPGVDQFEIVEEREQLC